MASSLFGGPARAATPATGNKAAGGINSQMVQQVKQAWTQFRTIANPMQDPRIAPLVQMCQGRSPQEVFMEQCRQYGIDPNTAFQQIQQMIS